MLKHIFSCESFVWNSCSKCQNDQLSMKNHVKRSFKDWKYYLHSKNDYHHILLSATFYWLINDFVVFFCCQKRGYLLFYDQANFAHLKTFWLKPINKSTIKNLKNFHSSLHIFQYFDMLSTELWAPLVWTPFVWRWNWLDIGSFAYTVHCTT